MGHAVTRGPADQILGHGKLFDQPLEDLLIVIGEFFEQGRTGCPGLLGEPVRHGLDVLLIAFVQDRLHRHEVHYAEVLLPFINGDLKRDRVGVEDLVHHGHALGRVRAGPVHLVDKGDPGHLIAIGLIPDRLALGLYPGNGAEEGHHSVEHAQGTLHLESEIDVPRGVDDVDPVVPPRTRDGGRGDGYSPLLLLSHEVHGGLAIVDFAHAVGGPGVEEHALGHRSLARVDVGGDSDVPDSI